MHILSIAAPIGPGHTFWGRDLKFCTYTPHKLSHASAITNLYPPSHPTPIFHRRRPKGLPCVKWEGAKQTKQTKPKVM